MNETLSALVDAELKAKEREKVLDAVLQDVEMQAAWGRYHVARAVLRKEWEGGLGTQLSAQIIAAIAKEPSMSIPAARAAGLLKMKGRSGVRQALGFAMAASLTAVVALFGLHMVASGEPASGTPLKTALTAPLTLPHRYIERAHWQGTRWRNRLNAFLLEHAAVAPLAGMNGLSYVHLAAYNGPSRGARNTP